MNELFLSRLKKIVPTEYFDPVVRSFQEPKSVSVRINTLKTSVEEFITFLKNEKIDFEQVSWCPEAVILKNKTFSLQEGLVYPQSLSSMLASVVLGPQPGEYVLDLCAAPGSKATHMAALMKNEGQIVCVEAVRERLYKLKSVCALMGAENIDLRLMDGRRFQARGQLFDRILVDAPCSSEGRFRFEDKKTFAYWSLRKIKEMVEKQRGLLLNASRLLKPGGVMVYSTCTFAPEENEGVVDWLLRKTEGRLKVDEIGFQDIPRYPAVAEWQNKVYNKQVQNCLRVLPGKQMDGFFITKFTTLGY